VIIQEDKHLYKAFGFNISSDFELDGLLPADGPSDVHVINGHVPVCFPDPENAYSYVSDGKEMFAFRIEDIGAYLIRNGSEIIVEKGPDSTSEGYALFILGTCMGALLMQRGLLPIHGSALSLENKDIIITGHSGAGKSTLTAYLYKMGYSFLADDISALRFEDGEARIMPAFPRQKLWRDTALHLLGNLDSLERIPGIRDKYHVPMNNQFITTNGRLSAIFEISVHEGNQVELEEVRGSEKLKTILVNTYRHELVGLKGIGAQHFLQCSEIAAKTHVFKIKRPETGYTVKEQAEAIVNALRNI
jgi:hypothetical protein